MNRPKLVPATCETCGQSFQARASDVRRGFGKACSRRCGGHLHNQGQRQASRAAEGASHPFQEGARLNEQNLPCVKPSAPHDVEKC